jgi:hypothetical protein
MVVAGHHKHLHFADSCLNNRDGGLELTNSMALSRSSRIERGMVSKHADANDGHHVYTYATARAKLHEINKTAREKANISGQHQVPPSPAVGPPHARRHDMTTDDGRRLLRDLVR